MFVHLFNCKYIYLTGSDKMPKIEIIDKVYFYKSVKIIIVMIICVLLGLIIGKGWYKKIKYLFKIKK